MSERLEIFAVTAPGLEPVLLDEVIAGGFETSKAEAGGVSFQGTWQDVWRANLCLRGASRILVRMGQFPAVHLSQLDKKARKFPWKSWLPEGAKVKVDASSRKSKIYHAGAAAQRIETALKEEMGAVIAEDAALRILLRIDQNLCTLSLDSSGDLLHKRGHKAAVAKAPMRENLAALFLHACGYNGTETVLDPMCGSGTFVLEAAEIARGLMPGRSRSFAFEALPSFRETAWQTLKASYAARPSPVQFYGSDRDAGAIKASLSNAQRAGVADMCHFQQANIAQLVPPDAPPGLIIINPPYGGRVGASQGLQVLYQTLGRSLRARFTGWRIGLVTTEARLVKATGLPFKKPGPIVDHGGLKVRLYRTAALGSGPI